MTDKALRTHNAAYLRHLADLIESGDYEMQGTGGATVDNDNVIVHMEAVFSPCNATVKFEKPVTMLELLDSLNLMVQMALSSGSKDYEQATINQALALLQRAKVEAL